MNKDASNSLKNIVLVTSHSWLVYLGTHAMHPLEPSPSERMNDVAHWTCIMNTGKVEPRHVCWFLVQPKEWLTMDPHLEAAMKQNKPCLLLQINWFEDAIVKVWADSVLGACATSHTFKKGSTTTWVYWVCVLHQHVWLFMGEVEPEFLYMDNNICLHMAYLVEDYLKYEDIHLMEWLACSLNLNPTEYEWNVQGRLVTGHVLSQCSLQELTRETQPSKFYCV